MRENIFEQAAEFALNAHRGQTRKGRGMYILHPLEAAVIAGSMTGDPEVMAAAVLHDVLEDTSVTKEQLTGLFGPRVCELVVKMSENKRRDMPKAATWHIRKQESLDKLRDSADRDFKIICLSDKLSNIRQLHRDLLSSPDSPDSIFDKFNVTDPLEHKWYYGSVLGLLSDLSEHQAYMEFETLFHAVFDRYGERKFE